LRKIHEDKDGNPILIFMTARPLTSEDRINLYDAGALYILEKPLCLEELVHMVGRALTFMKTSRARFQTKTASRLLKDLEVASHSMRTAFGY